MPRCFMAKKLKYPYEQWKERQERLSSRSPTPIKIEDIEEDNGPAGQFVVAGKLC